MWIYMSSYKAYLLKQTEQLLCRLENCKIPKEKLGIDGLQILSKSDYLLSSTKTLTCWTIASSLQVQLLWLLAFISLWTAYSWSGSFKIIACALLSYTINSPSQLFIPISNLSKLSKEISVVPSKTFFKTQTNGPYIPTLHIKHMVSALQHLHYKIIDPWSKWIQINNLPTVQIVKHCL